MPWGYLAAGLLQIAVAACFLVVGRGVMLRAPSQPAVRAFAIWWWALGAFVAIQGLVDLAAWAYGPDLRLYQLSRYPSVPLLCLATGGLSYFTLFLVTGRVWVARLAVPLYAATLMLLWAVTFLPPPTALRDNPWEIAPATSHPLLPLVYLLLGLPPILGSVAILAATWRAEGPERRRGRLVGTAILLYVGTGLVSYLALPPTWHFVVLVGGGFAAAFLSLRAYPPTRGKGRQQMTAGEWQALFRRRCAELL